MAAIQPFRTLRGLRTSISSLAQPPSDTEPRTTDWILISVVGALVVLGLFMAYSTTFYWSVSEDGNPMGYFLKQLGYAGIGVVLFIILSRVDYGFWNRMALPAIAVTVIALIAVLVFGTHRFGAQRTLFGGSLQPSEPAKIIILMYGAAWLASRRKQVTNIRVGLIPFVFFNALIVGLIALEPDISTSIIILLAASAMFFMAGASVIQIILSVGAAAGVAYLMVTFVQHASNRVAQFMNGFESVYQIKQGLIAIGSGGIFGYGIGLSYQKFGLLPAQNTDSVFAVVAEEMGLLGVALILGLLLVLAYRGLRIAQRADTLFGAFWAVGIIIWITMQALLNLLAMNGYLPLPGIPVPFISYGGSSLISVLAACGILVSISRGTKILSNSSDIDEGEEEQPRGGITEKVASANFRRRDSGTRSARTNRSKQVEDSSTEIIGRDVKFRPRLGRGSDTTGSGGSVRWRNGRYGTGTRDARGR